MKSKLPPTWKLRSILVSVSIAGAIAATAHVPVNAAPSIDHHIALEQNPTPLETPAHEHTDNEINRTIHDGYIDGGEYRCGTIGHGQSKGSCVPMRTPTIRAGSSPSAYFACPDSYPYPLEGFLSGNPVWIDKSPNASISVKAIFADGRKQRNYSYAGASNTSPGWIFVTGISLIDTPTITGTYACSDTPADPR